MYWTKEKAIRGHNKWVKKMTSKKIPETLSDVGTSQIGIMARAFDNEEKSN
jgi:hypothetical protein